MGVISFFSLSKTNKLEKNLKWTCRQLGKGIPKDSQRRLQAAHHHSAQEAEQLCTVGTQQSSEHHAVTMALKHLVPSEQPYHPSAEQQRESSSCIFVQAMQKQH